MKAQVLRVVGLVALALALTAAPAQAGLLGYWPLDETSGTNAPNLAPGGTNGTLYNGAAWFTDGTRGQVLSFDGNDAYVAAGSVPALAATTDDFSWSFWTYQVAATTNAVALGNRFNGAGGSWVKFTPNQFEYVPNGVDNRLNYADIPNGVWMHHAVVKSGTTLTYYRDGSTGSGSAWTRTVTSNMPTLPFFLGGDTTSENWPGRIDDVALYTHALNAGEVAGLEDGTYTPLDLAPHSPGGFTVVTTETVNSLTLDSFGLAIEINAAVEPEMYDVLNVIGALNLAGPLKILVSGGTLEAGDVIDIMNWGSLSGSFTSIDFASPGPSLIWNPTQLYTTGVLTVEAIPEPATCLLLGSGLLALLRRRRRVQL